MADLFLEGFELMLAGMAVVFAFLITLTGVVTLLTRLCPSASQPATTSADDAAISAALHSPAQPSSAEKLAAVTVAVQRYRAAQGRASEQQE